METVDDFVQFFEAIPEDQWSVPDEPSNTTRNCATGHLILRLIPKGVAAIEKLNEMFRPVCAKDPLIAILIT